MTSAAKSPVAGEPGGAATSPGSTTAACAHGKHLWVTIGRWLVRCDNCGLSGRLMWDGRVKAGERVYAGR